MKNKRKLGLRGIWGKWKEKKMQRKRKKSISTITEDFLKNDHIYTWISSDIFFKATRKGGVYLLFQYNHIPAKSKKKWIVVCSYWDVPCVISPRGLAGWSFWTNNKNWDEFKMIAYLLIIIHFKSHTFEWSGF